MALILTVTPNPSIDKVWRIPGFAAGGAFRVESVWSGAGGKGCNVARVAAQLAVLPLGRLAAHGLVDIVATGFAAGAAGRFVEEDLRSHGVQPAFFHLAAGETRTCPTIVDPTSGEVTEIREPGPEMKAGLTEDFLTHFRHLLDRARPGDDAGASGHLVAARAGSGVVTLSGSLPPGLEPDFYARVIETARERGLPSILDASGEALRRGVEAAPWAVKVNEAELTGSGFGKVEATALPRAIASEDEADLFARLLAVVRAGASWAVVTRGRRGLLASDGRTLWRGRLAGEIDIVQPVGSGDAATAALAVGACRRPRSDGGGTLLAGDGARDLITGMIAAGAANAVTEGIATCPPEVFEVMRSRVIVEALG